jgi:hypothetical protein
MRIRYFNNKETGVSTSVRTFQHPTNGAQYKVKLEGTNWFILDAATNLVAATGSHPNKNKAQLQVRAALESLGVEMVTDTRKRRQTVAA